MTAVLSPHASQGATTPGSPTSSSASSSTKQIPQSRPQSQSQLQSPPKSHQQPQPESVLTSQKKNQSEPSASASRPQSQSQGSEALSTSARSTSGTPASSKSQQQQAQHLAAPNAASPEANASSPRARSRDSPSSRRQSRLSNRTASSRPASSVFPIFPSSLSYALVRDFAYPAFHPLHYGAPTYETNPHSESNASSPGFGGAGYGYDRRLSDPPTSWEMNRGMWSAGPWGGDGGAVFGIQSGGAPGDQLPSTSFGYDSDDPEAVGAGRLTKNHRKSKSFAVGEEGAGDSSNSRRRRSERDSRRRESQKKDMSHLGTGLDSQGFFQAGATDEEEHDHAEGQQEEHDSALPRTSYLHHHGDEDDSLNHQKSQQHYHHHHDHDDGSSLDESFAGPSLALYTFHPENANELALEEGQIIEVGYRHGQGWLVAMNPDTGEQGLVPEEYVRLLSDIEGWGQDEDMDLETVEDETMTDYTGGDEVSTAAAAPASSQDGEDQRRQAAHEYNDKHDGRENNGDAEISMGDVQDALNKGLSQGRGEVGRSGGGSAEPSGEKEEQNHRHQQQQLPDRSKGGHS